MRHVKLLASTLLLALCGLLPASLHAADSTPPLVARKNSSSLAFKILQLADLHFTGDPTTKCQDAPKNLPSDDSPCTEALMSTFVDELLDAETPDFVVFSGDNVQTSSATKRQAAVDAFTKGVEQRKIPYAVIFGNHDDEAGFAREDIMKMVMQKTYSYAQRGPTDIDGVGNYQLSVQAPSTGAWGNANDSVFNMYFLDSGAYVNHTKYPDVKSIYDWIKPNQVEYYRNLSVATQKQLTTPLPALMFFHIPLQEFNYSSADLANVNGAKNEAVQGSQVHSEIFSALVDRNEVKAVFVGHDHINEYCYKHQGVQLCYGGGAGFGIAYGSPDFPRRARVIEWSVDRDNKRTIKSWKRLFGSVSDTCCHETLFNGSDATSTSAPQATPSSTKASQSGAAALDLRFPLLLSAVAVWSIQS
ncbi:Purple acid phosphatase 29 isoform 1 [Globisporangium polare]